MSALGRLAVNLSLDSAEYISGLSDAERKAAQTMRAIEDLFNSARAGMAAYTAAVSGAALALANLSNSASEFQDIAEKTGDAAAEVAKLKTAMDISGTGAQTLVGIMNKLTDSLAKNDDEAKGSRAALKALGIELQAFESMRTAERLQTLAQAFAQLEDGPKKSELAIAALGRSGAEILPLFGDLVEFGASQYALTEQQIAASDALSKEIAKLKSETHQLAMAAASDLAPSMSQVVKLLDQSLRYYRDAQVGSTALGAALAGLRTVMQTILVVGSDVAFVFKMVGVEIGGMAAQVAALARGDFKGFRAISDAMKEDTKRARAELDKYQASIMRGPAQAELYGGEARLGRGASGPMPALGNRPRAGGSGGLTDAQKEAQALAQLIDQLNAKASGFDSSFYKNFDLLNDALDKGKLSLTEFNRLQAQLISQQPGMREAAQKEIELARQRNAEFDAYFAQVERENAQVEGRIRSAREMYEGIQFETSLIGLNAVERQKAIAMRQLENAGIKEGTEAYEAYANKIRTALDAQAETNKAKEQFSSLSNSITQLLRGNSNAVKSLIDNMINEFLRLQVVEPILRGIFSSAGGIGGGLGGFIGSLFGGFRAEGGPVSGGKAYVVGERGPEVFMPSGAGTIVPNHALGGNPINITINNVIGSVASQEDVVKGMVTVRQQIKGELGRSMRMGGAFA